MYLVFTTMQSSHTIMLSKSAQSLLMLHAAQWRIQSKCSEIFLSFHLKVDWVQACSLMSCFTFDSTRLSLKTSSFKNVFNLNFFGLKFLWIEIIWFKFLQFEFLWFDDFHFFYFKFVAAQLYSKFLFIENQFSLKSFY